MGGFSLYIWMLHTLPKSKPYLIFNDLAWAVPFSAGRLTGPFQVLLQVLYMHRTRLIFSMTVVIPI